MKLSSTTPNFRLPFMGGAALLPPLVLSFLLGVSRGADECNVCSDCAGKLEEETFDAVFDAIGEEDDIQMYIVDGSTGKAKFDSYPACPSDNSGLNKTTLADWAKGTSCMSLHFSVKDGTAVTNVSSNILLACVTLAPVADLFKPYSPANHSSEDDYRGKVNMLSTKGLVADFMALKDAEGLDADDVTAGVLFCTGNNCNKLPENDQVDIEVTVEGYNPEYEDTTSAAYAQLKNAGERIAMAMCTKIGETCSESGFSGFKKVRKDSGKRQRRSTFNTEVIIFIETSPGTTPTVNEITNIYQAALEEVQANPGSLAILSSFTETIVVSVTPGGTPKESAAISTIVSNSGKFLASLCLLGAHFFV